MGTDSESGKIAGTDTVKKIDFLSVSPCSANLSLNPLVNGSTGGS